MRRKVKVIIDKSKWPSGPWTVEPDFLEWNTKAGLRGLILRNEAIGILCGYVAVTHEHPWYSLQYTDTRLSRLDVHGGLTYSEDRSPENPWFSWLRRATKSPLWWFGFDCGHAYDLIPVTSQFTAYGNGSYKSITYVRAEVESLAQQLTKAK